MGRADLVSIFAARLKISAIQIYFGSNNSNQIHTDIENSEIGDA